MSANTSEAIVTDRADWLLDAVATATQNRMFLRGDPGYDEVAGEAILANGAKAIRTAIERAQSAELASLRARCDAAEKDAKRYTKFRKWWFKYWASPSYEDDVSEAKTEAALDKAIDDLTAERAKEGETRK